MVSHISMMVNTLESERIHTLSRKEQCMSTPSQPIGRRERNKQDKLDRITAAARELFDQCGVDEVTTQQIADKADIGTGTLFLYAKTKSELLLLVQNSLYADAARSGAAAAERTTAVLDAVIAAIRPIVECNRAQIENGRTYLREVVFGDPEEPHHRDALALMLQTEEMIAAILQRDRTIGPAEAVTMARTVSSIMLLSMAASINIASNADDVVHDIENQVRVLLRC
ncbi:MAG TPA: TetR/AcrR family transcriptional regulator [Mycobacterium sp.]